MGVIRTQRPVLLLIGAFSKYPAALEWAREQCTARWGNIAHASPEFDFTETRFYQQTMGTGLKKLFWAFEQLVDPACLVECKHESNRLEVEYRDANLLPEPRPLNLDPGYLTEAKLVLATTKDRDHRIYLDRGIFAENTLYYQKSTWQTRPWTYPDYRRSDYHQFFDQCREYLRDRYQVLGVSFNTPGAID